MKNVEIAIIVFQNSVHIGRNIFSVVDIQLVERLNTTNGVENGERGNEMTHYYCYECKNGLGKSNGPCEYVDPIGELNNADHIKCEIGDAKWVEYFGNCCKKCDIFYNGECDAKCPHEKTTKCRGKWWACSSSGFGCENFEDK